MKFKKKSKVKGDDSNRYIITYADLLTLLLAFFVILYALSEPDEGKIEELGFFFESAFKPRTEQVELRNNNSMNADRIVRKPLTEGEKEMMKSISEQNNLRKVKLQIDQKIQELGLERHIQTDLRQSGLNIILTNEILFDPGSAEIFNEDVVGLIEDIRFIVSDLENKISIAGHTDDVPMSTEEFPSNWELSTGRAMSVLKILAKGKNGIEPTRLSATGYGEYSPIVPNDSVINRSKNRRVEIIIKREHSKGLLTTEGSG